MSDSYKNIAKTNLVFGGVKVLQVIVNVLKTKVVAVLLGPSGVGIQTLLLSTVTTLYQFTNCGISQSCVREISMNAEHERRSKIIQTLNTLALVLGMVAGLLCFLFSSVISKIVFGNDDFSWMFRVVSIALFFESVSTSQVAVLQGIRAIKPLAISSLIGSILVVVVSVPIYYYFGEKAIPAVVALGFALPGIVYFICRRRQFKLSIYCPSFDKGHAKSILTLGIALMASNGIMAIFTLCLNTFINLHGSSRDVGFYQAACTCTYSAINILVAILASDFFPRLSSQIDNNSVAWETTNTQIDLFVLVLGPIISIMVLFPNLFIRLLYSSEFVAVSTAVKIMGISLIFRIPWHCFSYIILAKGDKVKYLVVDAILGNGLFLVGNILGFYLNGINGIAVSFVFSSILVFAILYVTVSVSYGFKLSRTTIISGIAVLLSLVVMYLCNSQNESKMFIIISYIIFALLAIVCFASLERKAGVFSVLLCKLGLKKR